MEGHVFNIQKFCLHDGSGIRTTVFFKGCNLRCKWCANPESQQMTSQLTLDKNKCTGCGTCVAVCPQNARSMEEFPRVDTALCHSCGVCVESCPNGAIAMEGKTVNAEQVLAEVVKDEPFYETSGGGVTLSGGEVLLQLPFAAELIRRLREEKIHVAIETAGAVPEEPFAALVAETDYVLMDLKHYDCAAHRAGTGQGNKQVLANLRYLAKSGKPYLVRIPVIPGFNDKIADAAAFAQLLRSMEIKEVQLLPFHRMGCHKYELLGWQYDYADTPSLQREELEAYGREFSRMGIEVKL